MAKKCEECNERRKICCELVDSIHTEIKELNNKEDYEFKIIANSNDCGLRSADRTLYLKCCDFGIDNESKKDIGYFVIKVAKIDFFVHMVKLVNCAHCKPLNDKTLTTRFKLLKKQLSVFNSEYHSCRNKYDEAKDIIKDINNKEQVGKVIVDIEDKIISLEEMVANMEFTCKIMLELRIERLKLMNKTLVAMVTF